MKPAGVALLVLFSVAAVILPAHFADGSINDSKLLSAKQRKYLRQIIEKNAIGWAVEFIDNVIIDEINILMHPFSPCIKRLIKQANHLNSY